MKDKEHGWQLVRQPNGLLATYCSRTKDFTSTDLTDGEAVAMCQDVHKMTEEMALESIRLADKCPTRFVELMVEIEAKHGLAFAADTSERSNATRHGNLASCRPAR